jgi:arabinose-5-phosphate isomerase
MTHPPKSGNTDETIASGRRTVRLETASVAALESRINGEFAHAVDLIAGCKGRTIVTGVGKSGIIGRKIVATMNSTGTPSVFLHPSDALHGDLGIVRTEDVVVCISKSGATAEFNALLPVFKRLRVPVIALVGNMNSALARESTVALDASVTEEACPHDLAPTSSTTVTLVLGDALAIALLERRGFTQEDFAQYHPGGTLGKRLLLTIDELMIKGDAVPRVAAGVTLADAIVEMTTKRLGCTCVIKGNGKLAGLITDGDLRRLLQRKLDIPSLKASDVMTTTPKTTRPGVLAVKVLQDMERFSITQMIVVDDDSTPVGVVHLHDLVKAGLGGDEVS